jgi:hypothetical protein
MKKYLIVGPAGELVMPFSCNNLLFDLANPNEHVITTENAAGEKVQAVRIVLGDGVSVQEQP